MNADLSAQINVLARKSSPESTLRKIAALLDCRTALEGNVAPLLAVEATLIAWSRADSEVWSTNIHHSVFPGRLFSPYSRSSEGTNPRAFAPTTTR